MTFAKEWYQDNLNRWSPETVTRYEEILRLVPSYTPAAEKLAQIKQKEATAERTA